MFEVEILPLVLFAMEDEKKIIRKAFPRFESIEWPERADLAIVPFPFRARFVKFDLCFSDSCYPLEFVATCPNPTLDRNKHRLGFECYWNTCASIERMYLEERRSVTHIIWKQPVSLAQAYYCTKMVVEIDGYWQVCQVGLMGDMGPAKWRLLEKMVNGCCDRVDSTIWMFSRDLIRLVNEYVFGDKLDFYLNWNKS